MNDEKKNKLFEEMNAKEIAIWLNERKPNFEKQIAQAILDAQKMRDESYMPDINMDGEDTGFGEYAKNIEECLIETCKEQKLSENMWCLLDLAMHWWNDIQLWAEDVLVGKNILEECQKENTKMKDEIKRVGKMADDCPCNHVSKETCDQCQEIGIAKSDSAGKANPQNYC